MNTLHIESLKFLISPYQDRCENKLPEVSNPNDIHRIPVVCAYSKESDRYIPIKGLSVFKELFDMGEESILCTVVAEVETDNEAFLMRFSEVLDDRIPFHVLEQALCVASIMEETIREVGEDKFYRKGGDRRSVEFEKDSLLYAIGKQMLHKRSTLDIFMRFAKRLTSIGIKGLYLAIKEQGQEISLRKINATNAHLGKRQIRSQIDARVKKFQKDGKTDDEILQEIGALVYGVFFGYDDGKPNPSDTKKEHDDLANPDGPGTEEPAFRSVDEKGLIKIREAFEVHLTDQKNVQVFLGDKKELTEQDVSDLENMIKELEDSFTLFVAELGELSSNQ